jgi:hypothetical protein
MKRERLWYPPNSFPGVSHWAIETYRADGTYRVYSEHLTKAAAVAQLGRMVLRYPSHQLRLQEVAA